MCFPPFSAGLVVGLALVLAVPAQGAGPAEALLQLAPSDASATLAVEDLRGHAVEFLASPLAEGLRDLPTVRAWFASDRFQGFQEARRTMEAILNEKLPTIRDELFGDAWVLSLHLPAGQKPEQARGLLLLRPHNRALIDRLMVGVNAAQIKDGELVQIIERKRGKLSYSTREYRPGVRPEEYFTILDDNTLVWTNSETLMHGVLDRKSGSLSGIGQDARFQQIRRRLPARSVVSLFVNPRFLEAMIAASPPPEKPEDARLTAAIGRYLGAVEYAGAAIEWRNGFVLHVEEVLNPEKLAPWLRRWAARPGTSDPALRRVPATALGLVSAHADFIGLFDALRALSPESEQSKVDTLMIALKGMALGKDVRTAILPRLGPGLVLYAEPPEDANTNLSIVAIASVEGEAESAAIDNGLRTLLALNAIDDKNGVGRLRVETQSILSTTVTTLRPSTPFAFAVDRNRVVVGSSAEAVVRALKARNDEQAGDRFERAHATYFPHAATWGYVDLKAVHQYADENRGRFAHRLADRNHRAEAEVAQDLKQMLALMDLFEGAFATNAIAPDASAVSRSLGLLLRQASQIQRLQETKAPLK